MMYLVSASNKIRINAAYRLKASERLEDGQRLFQEIRKLAPRAQLSNVDGTIKLVGVDNPILLLTRLGFSGTAHDLPIMCRQDMNVKLVKPRAVWDDILYIIPH